MLRVENETQIAALCTLGVGKTQQFNYFLVNGDVADGVPKRAREARAAGTHAAGPNVPWSPPGRFYLVDVPGLGYAKAPEVARKSWAAFLERYLLEREKVAVVFHLVDARHGTEAVDLELFALLARIRDTREMPQLRHVIVLTKADKKDARFGSDAIAKVRDQLAVALGDDAAKATPVLVTSATSKRGRDAMWRELARAACPDDHALSSA